MPIKIPVEAQADNRSFKRSADSIERMFVVAGKDAGASFSKSFAGGASKDMDKAARDLSKSYDSVSNAAGKAKAAEAERQRQLERSKSLTDSLAKAEKKYAEALDAEGAEAKSAATALKEVERIKDAQARTNVQLVKTSETLKRSQREEVQHTRDAVAAFRDLEQARRKASAPLPSSGGSASHGPGAMSGLLSQSNGMIGQFSGLGGGAGKAFVAGAAAAIIAGSLVELGAKAAGLVADGFKAVMTTGIDFSKTVNDFQGATGATKSEADRMAAAARALGSDTTMAGVSASGAATAMTELAKAGFSVDQAIGAARGTMQLATAAGVDGAEAAKIQAGAMNAFGLDASQAAHVSDVFANAAQGSSAELPQIAQAMQQVGGIAHGFGENIEDTAAALAMFSQAGINGSDAGTLLKTTLQSITDQGNPAQEAIKDLGLSLYNFDTGQFVGFRELFAQLDEAKKRMSPEAFQAQTNILFGSDAMRSAMLGSVADFDKMLGVVNKVGTASDVAKAKMQGWPGVAEGLDNSMESLKLSIFDVFNTEEGVAAGQGLVDMVSAADEWVQTHKPQIIDGLTTIAAGFTETGEFVADFVSGTAKLMGVWVGAMTKPFGAVLSAMGEFMMDVGKTMSHIPFMGDTAAEISKGGAYAILGGTTLSHAQDQFTQWAAQADNVGNAFENATNQIHERGNAMADAARERQNPMGNSAGMGIGPIGGAGGGPVGGPGAAGQSGMPGRGGSGGSLFVDPSKYQVGGGEMAQGAFGDSREVFDANRAILTAKNNLEESKLKLAQLEAKGTADQAQLLKAKNDVHEDELKLQSAQMKLAEAQQGTLKKMESTAGKFSGGMEKIGAAIDEDFGLSNGLPGIAENLTRLIANMAMAPVVGALTGVQMAAGYDPDSGGSGLMGILGANGAFGSRFQPGAGGMNSGGSGGSGGGSGYSGDSALLAGVPAGRYSQSGNADLTKGLGDCSSAVEDLVNIMDGRPTGGRSMSTGNAAEWLTANGFLPGSMPGAFNVGYNSGHMQATLPGGTPFNWGSDSSAANRGIGGSGAFDPSFTSHYYRPVGAGGGGPMLGPALGGSGGSLGGGGGVTSVFVVNMPGGGFSGGQAPVVEISSPGGGAPPITPAFPPLSPGALTNPALTPPVAPFMPPLAPGGPTLLPGAAGASLAPTLPFQPTAPTAGPGTGAVGPGMSNPPSALTGGMSPLAAFGGGSATPIGGQAFPTQGGGGFGGVGGMPMAAISAAASGLDMLAPGAGQAAQIGIQLANRAAAFAGQAAGIGVSGLMETFLPAGDNPLSSIGNSWFGKIASGFAGARPAVPNMAGQKPPPNPNGDGQQSGQGGQGGSSTTNNISVTNNQASERQNADEIRRQMAVAGGRG